MCCNFYSVYESPFFFLVIHEWSAYLPLFLLDVWPKIPRIKYFDKTLFSENHLSMQDAILEIKTRLVSSPL